MFNAHVISFYADRAERMSALVYKLRGNLDLSLHAADLASAARVAMRVEQAAAVQPVTPVARSTQDEADAETGRNAYCSPDHADKRCPFRRPERAAAWLRGFNEMHAASRH